MTTSADPTKQAWLNHDKTIFTQKLVDIQLEHWEVEDEEDTQIICAIAEEMCELVFDHFTQKDPSK